MILVTGFKPYQESMNASGALIASLQADLPETLQTLKSQLAFELVAVDTRSREHESRSLVDRLQELLIRYRPTACVFTGQSPLAHCLTVEKLAVNAFQGAVIEPEGPAGVWADLPGLDRLIARLNHNSVAAVPSFYAGDSLCNHLLFSSCRLTQSHGYGHRSAFIHLPVLPEQSQLYPRAMAMPVSQSQRAITEVLLAVAAPS